ncbi:hypothetical protein [Oligoflexus tunisiensis]|uniref:hypothetical protein n=1 Tax=Oligoflexus tunisiensis TaxID=708132 RepID=UPI00114D3A76|nr:hypothetical protein [Oligoflexus tunisiensis]
MKKWSKGICSQALLGLLLACNPAGETDRRQTDDEDLVERTAGVSVPVSGTNLVFSVDESIDADTLDAYVVGYPDTLTAQKVAGRRYVIRDIPAGARDVIITGASPGARLVDQTFDRGLRLTQELKDGEIVDLGHLTLPKTGQLQGRLEMAGVAAFDTVAVNFPGTKLTGAKPGADGTYTVSNLPVGTHELAAAQADNPVPASTKAAVAEEAAEKAERVVIRSYPNVPTNLDILTRTNNLVLSWSTGGGDAEGYLVFKSSDGKTFQPKHGESYKPGAVAGGDIVYVGETPYFSDPAVKNGTKYSYQIFAYNKDRVYSEPLPGEGIPRTQDYAYLNYRIYFDSTASDCDGFGGTQVQQIRLHIDNLWQVNDFNANLPAGKIGPYAATISSNSVFNNAYDAFYAFQDNNSPWSSTDNAFSITDPFDVDPNVYPNGVYMSVQFGSTPVQITGMEILGGEPPFYPQCAPDRYHLEGSNDGVTFSAIPGSARSQVTIDRVRYYFAPQTKPQTATRLDLLANEGQVKAHWEKGAGSEIGFMLLRSETPVPFKPENGRPYNVGRQGDYEVIHVGNASSFMDQGLKSDGTVYYYTLLSYDTDFNYSTAIVGRAVPEARKTFRYYRFVLDSILGGEEVPNYTGWTDDLKVQINGQWIDTYSFTSEKGTIGSYEVAVAESTFNGTDRGWQVFTDGKWRTADNTFARQGQSHAVAKTGEFLILDFGSQPVALTGFRIFGNDAVDPVTGDFSDDMFAQIADAMHWERSADGRTWEVIPNSRSTSLAAEPIEVEW